MRFGLVFSLLLAAALRAEPSAKPAVFLAGSEPETISGEARVGDSRGALQLTRSAPSYDIETMRTFTRSCPDVVMTTKRDKADIIMRVEREDPNPTTPFVKANKIALFNLNDEFVYATRARLLTNASKDACRAILNFVKK